MRMGRWLGAMAVVCGLWACNPDSTPDGTPGADGGDTTKPDAGDQTLPDAGDEQTPDAGDQTPPDAGVLPTLKLTTVAPTTGVAGDAFTLTGTGLLASAQVYFGSAPVDAVTASEDGLQLTGKVPAKAEIDGSTVGVRVVLGEREARLEQAFTYASTQPALVQWCQLLPPVEATVWEGDQTPDFWAKAYQPDVTTGTGANAALQAQLGVGLPGAAPEAWAWTSAAFQKDEGNDDVYAAHVAAGAPGAYLYAFRFSLDGAHYTYCDTDGDAFTTASAGRLTVKGKPAIVAVAPASAKAGATVTVTGVNFASTAIFTFGANAATGVQLAADGKSATMTVPAGTGTVDVGVTVDGVTATKTGAFTYVVEPGAPVVATVAPAFLPIAGGTLTITGSQFGAAGATVTIGGQSAVVTAQTDTQLVVTAPAHAAGNQDVDVTASGKTTRAATAVAYVLKFTVNPDGDLSDWPAAAKVATSTTPSDWSDKNQLRALYLGYDQTNLYVGIEGAAEANNVIAGYLSIGSIGTFGWTDLTQLHDFQHGADGSSQQNSGALDDALSSSFRVTAPGFKAHYGFGLYGAAPSLDDSLSDGVGVRLLQDPENFAWSRATVRHTATSVEIAIPWRPANAGPTDAFVPFPAAPLKVQAFVRIVNGNGGAFPNQSLPADPNATASDAALHPQVSSVATIDVR